MSREATFANRYDGRYSGDRLNRIALPLGGIGAGMICIEGTGALSHLSLRHKPDVTNEPCVFSAICVKGEPNVARVLEGPVPTWKVFGRAGTGGGASGTTYGLPRFSQVSFCNRFPFAAIDLSDRNVPLNAQITAWSPFQPGDADDSSLPAAALEYRLTSTADRAIDAVFSHNARNFMAASGAHGAVARGPGGYVLSCAASEERPWDDAAFCAAVTDDQALVNCAWFRGGWWDALTMAWRDIQDGSSFERPPYDEGDPSPGATIFVPFTLEPGQTKSITLQFSWYVGRSDYQFCFDRGAEPQPASAPAPENYRPWYAGRFNDIEQTAAYWRQRYGALRDDAQRFSDCFYDSTLPPEVVEAVAANLTILKSPTVLRQVDGRLWCFEGCTDSAGCCAGSCTHVWNYAQALPHLFPDLERTLRETEFGESQNDEGHQQFRSSLPIRPSLHHFHAASDGQLGGIIKVFRDWRISGDTGWLKRLWPKVRASLDYCIGAWDPNRRGLVEEPHHNTYDIEFWGPDSMCTSFYLGALAAAIQMGRALDDDVDQYAVLLAKGTAYLEGELFNGDYFFQEVLRDKAQPAEVAGHTVEPAKRSAEAIELIRNEGPNYQYGTGCLADGVLGSWMAAVCGTGQVLDPRKVTSHLRSVHRHNLIRDLSNHANSQRPCYAVGNEGGLLLCTWPKGAKPSLPFVYSDEVWTGIEYQVASHLMLMGCVEEGLEIVRSCRNRYDGRVRNPFNEYECGHWYSRAMSSYALLQGLTGARYDAVEKTLHLEPRIEGDFRSFICTATGYGTVGVRDGEPFLEVRHGTIDFGVIRYIPRGGAAPVIERTSQ